MHLTRRCMNERPDSATWLTNEHKGSETVNGGSKRTSKVGNHGRLFDARGKPEQARCARRKRERWDPSTSRKPLKSTRTVIPARYDHRIRRGRSRWCMRDCDRKNQVGEGGTEREKCLGAGPVARETHSHGKCKYHETLHGSKGASTPGCESKKRETHMNS